MKSISEALTIEPEDYHEEPAKALEIRQPRQEITTRHHGAMTPMDMIAQALESGQGIEVIGKLMDLQERWEKNLGRKAFDAALSDAKAEIPPIFKNRVVDFTSTKGRTHYQHEDLGEIARTVDPILAKHGLSYRYRTHQDGSSVTVTCIVSHRDGHFEENTLSAVRDESGNKNSIQAVGSAITYLQRYTLKAALGLAASNDDDAKKANHAPEDDSTITEDQARILRKLIEDNDRDAEKFCTYFHIEAIPDLPAKEFGRAVTALSKKKDA